MPIIEERIRRALNIYRKDECMKYIKLHIWFVVNIGILVLFLLDIKLLASPLWILLVASNCLIGKGLNPKTRINKTKALLIFSFFVLFLLLIFNGALETLIKKVADNQLWLYIFIFFLVFIVILNYIKQIRAYWGQP